MFKVVKRPMEYIAIKVPEDCEDIEKFVINEAEKAGIRLYVTTYYADGRRWATKVGVKSIEALTAKRGSIIVCGISQDGSKYPEAVDILSQEEFDKKFKPVDDPVKGFSTTINVDAEPILDRLKEIKAEMSTKIEGVELPDHAGFSESFIAELDKALNEYHQKQGQSSQRTSHPHVRIDIDNIHDTPHVWIDGERVDDMHGDKKPNLSRVYVNWRAGDGADMQSGKHEFVIQHYEHDGKNMPKEIKTGERSITDKDD